MDYRPPVSGGSSLLSRFYGSVSSSSSPSGLWSRWSGRWSSSRGTTRGKPGRWRTRPASFDGFGFGTNIDQDNTGRARTEFGEIAFHHLNPFKFFVSFVYVTVNCGNQALTGMPEIFRQYWECL